MAEKGSEVEAGGESEFDQRAKHADEHGLQGLFGEWKLRARL